MKIRFGYKGRNLYLSSHAMDRVAERFNCRDYKEVVEKISETLNSGVVFKIKRPAHCKNNRETEIVHGAMRLHIRDNTIVTVTYNNAFYLAA